jgi:hypothetical protein
MADELIFEVTHEEDGGFSARAVGESIFTQGATWEELRSMVIDAEESAAPKSIRLHMSRKEVLSAA